MENFIFFEVKANNMKTANLVYIIPLLFYTKSNGSTQNRYTISEGNVNYNLYCERL